MTNEIEPQSLRLGGTICNKFKRVVRYYVDCIVFYVIGQIYHFYRHSEYSLFALFDKYKNIKTSFFENTENV